ncbi:MAG: hypothetical protein H6595_07705 [Flavobacteriales bacterium]|nr:hypothetical protein [Flavobacteriales bacterium]MCB9167351.1 hypothetical protein [Flavobacteriales bacterium]
MRTPALLLFLGNSATLFAQTLCVTPSADPVDQPAFAPDFISRSRITSIGGRAAVKREQEPIRDLDTRYLYRFDRDGRTIYRNTSFGHPGSGLDTASVVSTFNERGLVVQELHNDLNGFYAVETVYDSLDRPERRSYVRIVNQGPDRYHFVPGDRNVISDERFQYRNMSDSVRIRVHLNDLGLPYREETSTYDTWGYLRKVEDHYLVTGRRSRTEFRYNEKGRLAERTEQLDLSVSHVVRRTFQYDAAGDLMAMDEYHDQQHVAHEEYLYEEGTMFLKARLRREMSTGTIHLVRYSTERDAG